MKLKSIIGLLNVNMTIQNLNIFIVLSKTSNNIKTFFADLCSLDLNFPDFDLIF